MYKNIVVVDIDGTVANDRERAKKYLSCPDPMWDSYYADCDKDTPIPPIIDLVKHLQTLSRYKIIYCTGRREECRKKTMVWLTQYGLVDPGSKENTILIMRPNGNHKKDWELKPQLLSEFGIKKSDVAFILEDRNRMVDKWRELGFTCLQVAEGDF